MKFRLAAIAILIFASASGSIAQNQAYTDVPMFQGYLQSKNFNKSIHFTYHSGEMFLTVVINGKEYNFLFDTGAGTAISPQVAQELGLEEAGYIKISDGRGGSSVESMYLLDSVVLGGISFRDISCVRINTDALSVALCIPIDGIIGASMMQLCYWQINFANSRLIFSDIKPVIPAGAVALGFLENANSSPFIKMQTGDSVSYIEFDTGSNDMLALDDSVYFNNPGARNRPYAELHGATTETIYQKIQATSYRTIADSIKLDNTVFRKKIVDVSDLKNKLQLIGNAFMKNYEVTLDWKDHLIYLNKLSDSMDKSFTTSLGLAVALTGNKLNVTVVWKGSEAENNGIAPGDEILSVNGEDTQNLKEEDYCRIKEALHNADVVKMMIRTRDNKEKEYALKRYKLRGL